MTPGNDEMVKLAQAGGQGRNDSNSEALRRSAWCLPDPPRLSSQAKQAPGWLASVSLLSLALLLHQLLPVICWFILTSRNIISNNPIKRNDGV